MSIQAVAWVLEKSQAEGLDRLVLICLANHANPTGVCWPSQRTLAREARISKSGALNCLRRLVELGEVEIAEAGNERRSTRYRLPFADLEGGRVVTTPGRDVTAEVTPGVTAEVTPGVTRTIKNRHEPSVNASQKPKGPVFTSPAGTYPGPDEVPDPGSFATIIADLRRTAMKRSL